MISFALRCKPHSHRFDGWFRSGDDFERQAAGDLVTCPQCGSTQVSKALMRPAIGRGPGVARAGERAALEATSASAPEIQNADARSGIAPVAAASREVSGVAAGPAELLARLQAVTRELRAKSDYVGPRFAEEARRMHFGEIDHRSIYGEASKDEVEKLSEDGIAAIALPSLPEDAN